MWARSQSVERAGRVPCCAACAPKGKLLAGTDDDRPVRNGKIRLQKDEVLIVLRLGRATAV